MPDPYKICYRGGEGEIVEKKSRFIANIRPVETEEEAVAFIEETRKRYWDARHNCYAYILEKRPGRRVKITSDYGAVGKLQYLAGQMGFATLDSQYTDKVEMTLLMPEEQVKEGVDKITEATSGTAQIQVSDPFYYGMDGKELVLF